jgi:hypothetical protein
MSEGNISIPVGMVILDAAQVVNDPDFRRLGRPFYLSAAQRALRKMCMDAMSDRQTITIPITGPIVDVPAMVMDYNGVYVFNGNACDVNMSQRVRIKKNMHRLGGKGYIAMDKWDNHHDPLQFSHSGQSWGGWNMEPPRHLYFAGSYQGQLHLSDSCLRFNNLHIDYNGIGISGFGGDFEIPDWMREAVIDFIILRAAEALEREDPRHLGNLINRKQAEMKEPNGSWREAQWYWRRMSRQKRQDTLEMMFRLGHA